MCDINDPLGQSHSPASSDHYSRLKMVLFCEILKCRDGRTDGQTTRAKIVITTVGRPRGSKGLRFANVYNQPPYIYVPTIRKLLWVASVAI